jgi:transposase
VPDRAALAGIIFVLKTGISWNDLPQELGCGSGVTCWRRLQQWQEEGVWERLHRAVLDRLGQHDLLGYPRCRRYLQRRGIRVRIARRGIEDSSRLGRVRWVVERTMSWLLGFRRLALRYDRTETTVSALLTLACTLICHRRLPPDDRPQPRR